MNLIWARGLAIDLGIGWITTVPDGRHVAVITREHPVLGRRWFVYARPHDCESWGKPYELNGFSSVKTAQAYVENGFQWPQVSTLRTAAREVLSDISAQIDRINTNSVFGPGKPVRIAREIEGWGTYGLRGSDIGTLQGVIAEAAQGHTNFGPVWIVEIKNEIGKTVRIFVPERMLDLLPEAA